MMHSKRFSIKQRGFSLVQTLIGIGITAGAATLGMRVMDNMQKATKMVEKKSAISTIMNEINTNLLSKAVCQANLTVAFNGQEHYGLSNYSANDTYLAKSLTELYGNNQRVIIKKGDSLGTQQLFEVSDIKMRIHNVKAATGATYTHTASAQAYVVFKTCRKGLTNCEESKKVTITKIAPIPNINLIADSQNITSFDCASGQDGLLEQACLDSNEKIEKVVDEVNSKFNTVEADYISKIQADRQMICKLKADFNALVGIAGAVDATLCPGLSVSIVDVVKDFTSSTSSWPVPADIVKGSFKAFVIGGGGGGASADHDQGACGGKAATEVNKSYPDIKEASNCSVTVGAKGSGGQRPSTNATNSIAGGSGGSSTFTCEGISVTSVGGAGAKDIEGSDGCSTPKHGQNGYSSNFDGVTYVGGAGGDFDGPGSFHGQAPASGRYGAGGGGGSEKGDGHGTGSGGDGHKGIVRVKYKKSTITGSYTPVVAGNYTNLNASDYFGNCGSTTSSGDSIGDSITADSINAGDLSNNSNTVAATSDQSSGDSSGNTSSNTFAEASASTSNNDPAVSVTDATYTADPISTSIKTQTEEPYIPLSEPESTLYQAPDSGTSPTSSEEAVVEYPTLDLGGMEGSDAQDLPSAPVDLSSGEDLAIVPTPATDSPSSSSGAPADWDSSQNKVISKMGAE